jgi:hypothetical protein
MLTPDRWLSRGWRAFALNMGAFIGAMLILLVGVVLSLTLLWFAVNMGAFVGAMLILLAGVVLSATLLVIPLELGLIEMALRARRGEPVAAWEITRGFRFLLPGLVLWLMGVAAGITLCVGSHLPVVRLLTGVVGGPLLNLFGMLAALCIVDRGIGVREALGRVLLIVERHWLGLWAVSLLFLFLQNLGDLCFGIGTLVTVPWIACSWAAAYQDLFDRP